MPGASERWRRWRMLGIACLAVAVALGIHGLFHAWVPAGARPVPWLAGLPWLIALFGGFAVIAALIADLRRVAGPGRKLAVGLAYAVASLGAATGLIASDPSFPFGPTYVADAALPGDRGTAYLYQGGLFCSQSIWIAAPGAWLATLQPQLGTYTCTREGHPLWDAAAGRVRVVDASGHELGEPTELAGIGEGLYWGPH